MYNNNKFNNSNNSQTLQQSSVQNAGTYESDATLVPPLVTMQTPPEPTIITPTAPANSNINLSQTPVYISSISSPSIAVATNPTTSNATSPITASTAASVTPKATSRHKWLIAITNAANACGKFLGDDPLMMRMLVGQQSIGIVDKDTIKSCLRNMLIVQKYALDKIAEAMEKNGQAFVTTGDARVKSWLAFNIEHLANEKMVEILQGIEGTDIEKDRIYNVIMGLIFTYFNPFETQIGMNSPVQSLFRGIFGFDWNGPEKGMNSIFDFNKYNTSSNMLTISAVIEGMIKKANGQQAEASVPVTPAMTAVPAPTATVSPAALSVVPPAVTPVAAPAVPSAVTSTVGSPKPAITTSTPMPVRGTQAQAPDTLATDGNAIVPFSARQRNISSSTTSSTSIANTGTNPNLGNGFRVVGQPQTTLGARANAATDMNAPKVTNKVINLDEETAKLLNPTSTTSTNSANATNATATKVDTKKNNVTTSATGDVAPPKTSATANTTAATKASEARAEQVVLPIVQTAKGVKRMIADVMGSGGELAPKIVKGSLALWHEQRAGKPPLAYEALMLEAFYSGGDSRHEKSEEVAAVDYLKAYLDEVIKLALKKLLGNLEFTPDNTPVTPYEIKEIFIPAIFGALNDATNETVLKHERKHFNSLFASEHSTNITARKSMFMTWILNAPTQLNPLKRFLDSIAKGWGEIAQWDAYRINQQTLQKFQDINPSDQKQSGRVEHAYSTLANLAIGKSQGFTLSAFAPSVSSTSSNQAPMRTQGSVQKIILGVRRGLFEACIAANVNRYEVDKVFCSGFTGSMTLFEIYMHILNVLEVFAPQKDRCGIKLEYIEVKEHIEDLKRLLLEGDVYIQLPDLSSVTKLTKAQIEEACNPYAQQAQYNYGAIMPYAKQSSSTGQNSVDCEAYLAEHRRETVKQLERSVLSVVHQLEEKYRAEWKENVQRFNAVRGAGFSIYRPDYYRAYVHSQVMTKLQSKLEQVHAGQGSFLPQIPGIIEDAVTEVAQAVSSEMAVNGIGGTLEDWKKIARGENWEAIGILLSNLRSWHEGSLANGGSFFGQLPDHILQLSYCALSGYYKSVSSDFEFINNDNVVCHNGAPDSMLPDRIKAADGFITDIFKTARDEFPILFENLCKTFHAGYLSVYDANPLLNVVRGIVKSFDNAQTIPPKIHKSISDSIYKKADELHFMAQNKPFPRGCIPACFDSNLTFARIKEIEDEKSNNGAKQTALDYMPAVQERRKKYDAVVADLRSTIGALAKAYRDAAERTVDRAHIVHYQVRVLTRLEQIIDSREKPVTTLASEVNNVINAVASEVRKDRIEFSGITATDATNQEIANLLKESANPDSRMCQFISALEGLPRADRDLVQCVSNLQQNTGAHIDTTQNTLRAYIEGRGGDFDAANHQTRLYSNTENAIEGALKTLFDGNKNGKHSSEVLHWLNELVTKVLGYVQNEKLNDREVNKIFKEIGIEVKTVKSTEQQFGENAKTSEVKEIKIEVPLSNKIKMTLEVKAGKVDVVATGNSGKFMSQSSRGLSSSCAAGLSFTDGKKADVKAIIDALSKVIKKFEDYENRMQKQADYESRRQMQTHQAPRRVPTTSSTSTSTSTTPVPQQQQQPHPVQRQQQQQPHRLTQLQQQQPQVGINPRVVNGAFSGNPNSMFGNPNGINRNFPVNVVQLEDGVMKNVSSSSSSNSKRLALPAPEAPQWLEPPWKQQQPSGQQLARQAQQPPRPQAPNQQARVVQGALKKSSTFVDCTTLLPNSQPSQIYTLPTQIPMLLAPTRDTKDTKDGNEASGENGQEAEKRRKRDCSLQ